MPSKLSAIYMSIAFGTLFLGIPLGEPSVGFVLILIAGLVSLIINPMKSLNTLKAFFPKTAMLFLLWFPVNIAFSTHPKYTAVLLLGYGAVIAISVVSMRVFVRMSKQQIHVQQTIFMVGSYLVALYALYSHFIKGLYRAVAPFTAENQLGTLLIITLLFAIGAISDSRSRLGKCAAIALVPLTLGALLVSESRGAWVGSMAAIVVYSMKGRQARWLGLSVLALLGISVKVFKPISDRFLSIFNVATTGDRIAAWKSSLHMIRDYPVFGTGGGTFPFVYPQYKLPGTSEATLWHAHNAYLEIAVEFGLIGLALFLGVMVATFTAGLRVSKSGSSGHALFAAFIGILAHQIFDATIVTFEICGAFWVLVGLLIAWGEEIRKLPA